MNEAKFLRRGLHMTSYDKSDQKGGALNFTNTNQKALPYDSDSTNSGQPQRVRKPPRHDRPHSRSARGPSRYVMLCLSKHELISRNFLNRLIDVAIYKKF